MTVINEDDNDEERKERDSEKYCCQMDIARSFRLCVLGSLGLKDYDSATLRCKIYHLATFTKKYHIQCSIKKVNNRLQEFVLRPEGVATQNHATYKMLFCLVLNLKGRHGRRRPRLGLITLSQEGHTRRAVA